MQENRIVLDTNIWISYFLDDNVGELFTYLRDNAVIYCRSKILTTEFKEVISRPKFKKKFTRPIDEYVSVFKNLSRYFEVKERFNSCIDPKDNFLFDLAEQSMSKFLVSGDHDVLNTKVDFDVEILNLSDFKTRMQKYKKVNPMLN